MTSTDKLRRWIRSLYTPNCGTLKLEAEKIADEIDAEFAEYEYAQEFLTRIGSKCGMSDCPSLVTYVNRLESENRELREAATAWMEHCNIYLYACVDCPYRNEADHAKPCKIHEMLCDMGIGRES